MEKAKRARTAETPKQPSLCLRLRAPYFYPDLGSTAATTGNVGTFWLLVTITTCKFSETHPATRP